MKKPKLDEAIVLNKSDYTKDEYKFICELIWGCVPIDRTLAEGTNIFKQNANLILEKYPKLNKSFHEKFDGVYYRGKKLKLTQKFIKKIKLKIESLFNKKNKFG